VRKWKESGWGAALEQGEAVGVFGRNGMALQQWVDGGQKLVGFGGEYGGVWPAMGLGLAFYRPNVGRMSTGKGFWGGQACRSSDFGSGVAPPWRPARCQVEKVFGWRGAR